MTGKVTLRLNPVRPGEAVSLELWQEEELLAYIILEAPDVTDLIKGLANARASFVDEVAREIDPGTKHIAVLDPLWRTPKVHPEGRRALALRHPGLGWLSFVLPEHEAAALAVSLTADTERSHPLIPADNANPFLSMFRLEITRHAQTVIADRKIDREWINRALLTPDTREPDPGDASLIRHYKAIPEREGRVLRLVLAPLSNGFRVVTVFFDRGRR